MAEKYSMKGGKALPLSKRNIVKVKVNGVEKRYRPSRHYVFILQVRWSDLSEYVIYRKYSDFYTLQCSLVEKFPIEAGAIRETDRTLPYLPGRLLFSRTEISKVANQRKHDLAKYCSSLLDLDTKISRCTEVLDFFEATFEDINPPKDATKKPDRSRLLLALLPFLKRKNIECDNGEDLSISGPITLETYVVVADYETSDKCEVTLTEGAHVEVFEKNNNGWWFVQLDSGKQGWAPASYLDPVSHPLEIDEPDPTYKGNLEKYITTEAYKAQFSDELSFGKDVVLEVMHKLLDGWWIVSYQGDAGYVPAAYLEPYNNPHFLRSSTVRRPTVKPIPRRCTVRNKSKALKQATERDLTLYRKYSKKRKAEQSVLNVPIAPPKPPRIIEEDEDEGTSHYMNAQISALLALSEKQNDSDAIYGNVSVSSTQEVRMKPVPPPKLGKRNKKLNSTTVSPQPDAQNSTVIHDDDEHCHSIPDQITPESFNETAQILSQIEALKIESKRVQPKYNKAPPPPYIPILPAGDKQFEKPLLSPISDFGSVPSTPSSGYGSERSQRSPSPTNESHDIALSTEENEERVSVTKL